LNSSRRRKANNRSDCQKLNGSSSHVLTATAFSYEKANKKSELMLMRRARAYGSSCLQVHGLSPSILSQFTLLQPKIT